MKSSTDNFLERVWEQREEKIYPAIFGSKGKGIYALSGEIFTKQFGQSEIDPLWLTIGVFEYPPIESRKSWIYVSSGLSNPWDSEECEDISGIGCELLLEVTEPGTWAIQRVQEIAAYQLLLAHGRYGDRETLGCWDRIPLRRSVTPEYESKIRNLFLHPPTQFPEMFDLESGEVFLMAATGITDEEMGFAKANGSDKLLELLQRSGIVATDPRRKSVV